MWPSVMALRVIHQAWSVGGNIISVNLGESFMGAGGNVEGLLGIYLFKPFGRLGASGVYRTKPHSPPPISLKKAPTQPLSPGLIASRVGATT